MWLACGSRCGDGGGCGVRRLKADKPAEFLWTDPDRLRLQQQLGLGTALLDHTTTSQLADT